MPTSVTRPARLPYRPSALLELPYRLLNPPPAPCKVGTFKISPDFEIDLEDMLANKHVSPLALKDFEEYLLFTEFSAENLYFIMWLKDYTKIYDRYVKTSKVPPGELALRFSRALSTFFDPTSNLALNLPADLTSQIIALSKQSSHPLPAQFEEVQGQVKAMLRDSLERFVRMSFGNAGRNRSWFSASLGFFLIASGLVPTFVSIFLPASRWIRVSGFLFIAIGIAAVIAASRGLCLLLYSFGDARQLYAYELPAPKLPETIISTEKLDPIDEEEKTVGLAPLGSTEDGHQIVLLTASFIAASDTASTAPTSPTTAVGDAFKFDFDALPPTSSRSSVSTSSSPGTFGSITRVISPLIRRSHWEVAIRSLILGHIIALVFTAVLVVLPSPYDRV